MHNVASLQKNRGDKSHHVIVALLPRIFGLYVYCYCFILLSLISMPASLILYLIVQSLPDLYVLANQIARKKMVSSRSLVHTFASVHVNIQVILYYLVSRFLALIHVSIPFVFHHIKMNDTSYQTYD